MALDVYIKRKKACGTFEQVASFKDNDHIRQFFLHRKFRDNEHKKLNKLSMLILRRDLEQKLSELTQKSNLNLRDKIAIALDKLNHAIHETSKKDELYYYCTFEET